MTSKYIEQRTVRAFKHLRPWERSRFRQNQDDFYLPNEEGYYPGDAFLIRHLENNKGNDVIKIDNTFSAFPGGAGRHHTPHTKPSGDIFISETISKDSTAGQQANCIHLLAELGKKNATRFFLDVEASIGQSPKIFLRDDSRFINEQFETTAPKAPEPVTLDNDFLSTLPPRHENSHESKVKFAQEYIQLARKEDPVYAQENTRMARKNESPVYHVHKSEDDDAESYYTDDDQYQYESEEEERPYQPSEPLDHYDRIIGRGSNSPPGRVFTTYTPRNESTHTPSPRSYWFDHNSRPKRSSSKRHDIGIFKPSEDATISQATLSPSFPSLRTRPRSPLPSSVNQRRDSTKLQSETADLPSGPARFNLGLFPKPSHSSLGNLPKGNKIQAFGQGGSPGRIQTSGTHLYPRQKTLEEMAGIMPRASGQLGP